MKWYNYDNGKEGSVRETQEGCPSPFKSLVFETFSKFQKLRQRGEKIFSTRCIWLLRHFCPRDIIKKTL